jgi:membrane-associated protease RseP (regulator of RpoE activity)
MSDQRPPSNPWVEMWKTAVSGTVAICSVAACTGIVFAGLAFTHGGAQISFHELSISLPARANDPSPAPIAETVPSPPIVAPVARLAIPYLGIWYRETTVSDFEPSGTFDRLVAWSENGRFLDTLNGTNQPRPRDLCGARVMAVRPNSPAEHVGLQPGDVIVGVDSRLLFDGLDLRSRVRGANVGQQITLILYRDDRLLRVPVVLGVLPLGEE